MHVTVGGYRSRVRVHKVDVAVPRDLKVGLLPGVDTTTYEVLQALLGQSRIEKFEAGQPIPILDNQRFHTIVVDIRALRDENFRRGFARLLDFVEQGVANGLPERESWRAAFAMTVSLVWIYTNLLRILAYFSQD